MNISYALIIALLTAESDCAAKPRTPTREYLNTVQYWFTPDSSWRISTFAADKNIQFSVLEAPVADSEYNLDAAVIDTKKRYGNAIRRIEVLELDDPFDVQVALTALSSHNLDGELEFAENGIIFYNPDNGHYRPRSEGPPPAAR